MNEYQYRARLRADGHDSDTIAERVDNWASDDYDRRRDDALEPNVHPIMADALRGVRPPWPFPARLIPPGPKAPPAGPDLEPAPW